MQPFHGKNLLFSLSLLAACLLILLLPARCLAQAPDIKFKQISIEQGLSNSWVEAICQGGRGFMWFGTRDGLDRYDGKQIKVYRTNAKDTTSISDNFIRYIYEDREHKMWIGTANGLNVFDEAKDEFTRYKHSASNANSLSNNVITCIYEDSKNNLWVCTNGGGLNLFNRKEKSFSNFRHSSNSASISNDIVNYITEDANGNLWVATESGLNLFNRQSNSFTLYKNTVDEETTNVVRFIAPAKSGNLFLGTPNAGVIVFNPVQKTFTQLSHQPGNDSSLSGNFVYSMLASRNGNIWVGIVNEGLNLYNAASNSFRHYRHEPSNAGSLAQRTASAIYEDRQGNLWVGTHRGGVSLYAPGADKFKLYRQEADIKSISYSDVKSFCQDNKGNIWVGTDGGGLNLFNRKTNTFTHYLYDAGKPDGINSDAILDITEDKAGYLWISTWGGGLNKFNTVTGVFQHFKNNAADKTTISSNFVQKTFEDSEGNFWVGTYYGGLNLMDRATNKFTHITGDSTGSTHMIGNNVVAINQDKNNNIWIGTDDGGLNCYNLKTKRFTNYFNTSEKSPDFRVIFVDSKGQVWAGQLGLYMFDATRNSFSIYPGEAGFATEFIKGITEDENGNLWVSTSKGLAMFNPSSHAFKRFNIADGLQGSEYESNAFLRADDGEMFFGGNTGLNTFYPKDIKTNSFVPPVYITGFQIFNKEVVADTEGSPLHTDITATKEITLNYKQSSISFDFAALNYVTAENNQYAYQLENLDKDWTYAGSATRASYTNLSPGKYVFHVKASNNDGVWNETGASINITITPPFWQTWWFRSLAALIIIGGIYGYYQMRVSNIKRQKAALEKQVKERTFEVERKAAQLQEVNEELQAQSEELQEVNEELQVQSEELSVQAAHLKELNIQLEAQKEQELEKAVAQNKFEIASEVLHDVGNALVGFGAHVTRINRALDQNNQDNMQNLSVFIKAQQAAIATVIGPEKANALTVISEGVAKSQKASKEDIRKSVTELFNIISHIEQILSIQRQYVKSHTGAHIRKAVELENVINDCRAMLSATLDKKGINLNVNIEPGRHVIKGDQTKLMQVILNVLKNSMEAIPMESVKKNINIHLQTVDNIIELTLTDTGHGFDEATGSQLFRRGFTTKETGSGLGLYNCRSIVESHDGTFEIKSAGRGLGVVTIIKFTL